MKVNWLAVFGSLLTQMPLALGLAIVLSRKGFGMKAYRTVIFAPQAMSIAAVALLWRLIYSPYFGPLNHLLRAIGLDTLAIGWLGDPDTALISVLMAAAWFYFGFHMVIFMAGLASIPDEIYDAVRLETNSWFHTLIYITLPLLREQLLLSFVFILAGTFGSLMGFVSLLTDGGPANATELLGIYMARQAFRGNRYGYASAISVILLLTVGLALVWPALRVARERLEY
jgi:raffinose/stachyose/melibiose transport system permease protein